MKLLKTSTESRAASFTLGVSLCRVPVKRFDFVGGDTTRDVSGVKHALQRIQDRGVWGGSDGLC